MIKIIKNISSKITANFDKFAVRLSEDNLIRIDKRSIVFIGLLTVTLFISVIFRLHTSSIYVWKNFIPEGSKIEGNIIGAPRPIRSDEWLITTPFIVSQIKNNFNINNYSIGPNTDPMLMSLPTKHLTTLLRPQFWGFFILDEERAFSLYWDIKIYGLFISTFLVLMILTKGKFWISVFGSFWLYFSSFTQWWFSAQIPEVITAANLTLIGIIYILYAKKNHNLWLGGVAFTLGAFNFIVTFYPPFLVSVAFLYLFILGGYMISQNKNIIKIMKEKKRLLTLIITSTVIISALAYYIRDAWPTIKAILETAYPGKRISLGNDGGYELFSGYFSSFYKGSSMLPVKLNNTCEASNYILLFPLVFISMAVDYLKNKKIDKMLLGITIFIIIIMLWIFFTWPLFLAKITLFSYVAPRRAFLAFGVASIFISVIYLSKKIIHDKKVSIITAIVFGLSVLIYGLYFNNLIGNYFKPFGVLLAALFFTILGYLFMRNKIVSFAVILIVYSVFFFGRINPIGYGLKVFKETGISQVSDSNINKNDPWVVYSPPIPANYLKAIGFNVFNGVKYTPDMKALSILDPDGLYKNIYNRYAHIWVQEVKKEKPPFELVGPDQYKIYIDPCSPLLKEIGVKNIAFTYIPEDKYNSCLMPLGVNGITGYWMYKIK